MLKYIKAVFKDYFWDFYQWSQQVPIDKYIDDVKKQLPSYVKVDWQNPEPFGKGLLYPVIWIKGHKFRHKKYLGFVDGLYAGYTTIGQ